jgi:uncharacterized protein YggE
MNPSMPRTVTVSGEGVLHVQPDKATVRFGVVTRHADPEQARRLNAEAAREAMNAVRRLGIEERKLQLQALSLQPVREYNQATNQWEDKGYEAAREVVVELEDLEKLPEVIAQVVQKGANRLNGLSYDVKDRQAVRNEALRQAVLAARDKAQLMATTLGATLGPIWQIAEQGISMPPPILRMAEAAVPKAMASASAEPEAYAAGEIEVTATVQLVFVLSGQ